MTDFVTISLYIIIHKTHPMCKIVNTHKNYNFHLKNGLEKWYEHITYIREISLLPDLISAFHRVRSVKCAIWFLGLNNAI